MSHHLLKVHARPAVHGAAQIARQRLQKWRVDRRATRQDAVERMQAEPGCTTECQRERVEEVVLAIRTAYQMTQFRLNVISAPSARALTDRAWLTIADHWNATTCCTLSVVF